MTADELREQWKTLLERIESAICEAEFQEECRLRVLLADIGNEAKASASNYYYSALSHD